MIWCVIVVFIVVIYVRFIVLQFDLIIGSLLEMFKQVEIFIDGLCLGNLGFGGYGVILCYCGCEKIFSVGYICIINNCMELMVVIVVLEVLKEYCEVILSIDSQYVCQGIIQWIYNWKKCGWKIVDKKLVKNVDFW